MDPQQLSSLGCLKGGPGGSAIHLSASEAAQLMSCGHHAALQQAEASSNFSYNSMSNSHSCTSSFYASCDSSVQQHVSDSSGYHQSDDTMGCLSSSGNWQCEGDLTLADILNMSVTGGLQPQGAPLGGQAVGQLHSCRPRWGPQQGVPLPAVQVSCVGTLPHPGETMASLQGLQQATGLAAYETAALNGSRPGLLGGVTTEQQLLEQLMQQVEAVTATGGFSAAADTTPAALGFEGGQMMVSALAPSANPSLAVASAAGTSLTMGATEQLQLEWLQQRNALLQQQLVQQQELMQEQQRQQERLQQQLQLQLLLQQQQQGGMQQQGGVQQQGHTTWPSDVDLLAAAFPDLNISSSSSKQLRQATTVGHNNVALLLQQLPPDVGPAAGAPPLVVLDTGRGGSSRSGLGGAAATAVQSPDDAALLRAALPGQQVPYTMRMEQVVLQAVPAAGNVPAVLPAPAANSVALAQQPQQQQQQQVEFNSSTQTVGTGVFIRGAGTGAVSPAGSADPSRQQAAVTLSVVEASSGVFGSSSSDSKFTSYPAMVQAGAAGVSSSTARPQSDQLSKSRSFDGSSRLSSPFTAVAPDVRRSNSSSSRGRHSFDNAKPAVKRPEAQGSSGTTPPPGASSSIQHSSDGSGISSRRSLPGRHGKGHSPVRRCAPKWAPQGWDPKAQVAELGAAAQKGTGAFIPGAMRRPISTGALDQTESREATPAVEPPTDSTTACDA